MKNVKIAGLGVVPCFYAKTNQFLGQIHADSGGAFSDDYVYELWGSTADYFSPYINIGLDAVSNILYMTTTPSSYQLFWDDETFDVTNGFIYVGVSGHLDTASQDGSFDAHVSVNETGGKEFGNSDFDNVTVDTYYD